MFSCHPELENDARVAPESKKQSLGVCHDGDPSSGRWPPSPLCGGEKDLGWVPTAKSGTIVRRSSPIETLLPQVLGGEGGQGPDEGGGAAFARSEKNIECLGSREDGEGPPAQCQGGPSLRSG